MSVIPHCPCNPLDVGAVMNPFYRQEHLGIKVKRLARMTQLVNGGGSL